MGIHSIVQRTESTATLATQRAVRSESTAAGAATRAQEAGALDSIPAGNASPLRREIAAEPRAVAATSADAVVEQLNQFIQRVSRDLQFSVDEATGKSLITVRDGKTDEVIRQIPAEHLVKLAADLQERLESDPGRGSGEGPSVSVLRPALGGLLQAEA